MMIILMDFDFISQVKTRRECFHPHSSLYDLPLRIRNFMAFVATLPTYLLPPTSFCHALGPWGLTRRGAVCKEGQSKLWCYTFQAEQDGKPI